MLHLPGLLTPAQLARLNAIAATGRFVDGRATATGMAAEAKRNEQLERTDATTREITEIVFAALQASAAFQNWALPKVIAAPMINRHAPGMYYDRHLDSPLMQAAGPASPTLRSDLSLTIFLTPPQAYEGGALVIETEGGAESEVKLPAGDGFAYNTTVLHRVDRVTAGTRLAAVTWIQSYVRDPAQRAILYQLGEAKAQILAAAPESEAAELLNHCASNLLRMWLDV